MIINGDATGIEWRVVAHQSGDKTAIEEINNKVDVHSVNKARFKLPERVIAKTFLFRAIFKGSAYAYANDPQFMHVSTSEKYWQRVIDEFYEKYDGIYRYHNALIQEATSTGKIVLLNGLEWDFEPRLRRGELQWPEKDIVNYPVQGTAALIMAIARKTLRTKLENSNFIYYFVNTVHDSIVLDVDNTRDNWYNICIEMKEAFQESGNNYEKLFGEKLLVPMDGEIKVGINWGWMHDLVIKGK